MRRVHFPPLCPAPRPWWRRTGPILQNSRCEIEVNAEEATLNWPAIIKSLLFASASAPLTTKSRRRLMRFSFSWMQTPLDRCPIFSNVGISWMVTRGLHNLHVGHGMWPPRNALCCGLRRWWKIMSLACAWAATPQLNKSARVLYRALSRFVLQHLEFSQMCSIT